MANWKEIQGRIRRAKKSEDPATPLTALYEKTRDAMVAFELARHLEQAGDTAGAGRWYSTAAAGFRRPQWKAKAEEALARLGVTPAGAGVPGAPAERRIAETSSTTESAEATENIEAGQEPLSGSEGAAPAAESAGAPAEAVPAHRRRRRGRRGGRRHRRGRMGASEMATPAKPVAPERVAAEAREGEAEIHEEPSGTRWRTAAAAAETLPLAEEGSSEAVARLGGVRGRAGDPGLSSRIALLESQLRRLLAGTQAGVDEADHAPAGPGVFLLSDSDLQTHYYVEACQTLRIGIGNLLRAGRQAGGRGAAGPALKARLAKHLGISETKAAKYLSDHCAVRWLQLDDGANLLAHFAIAVLRPVLNE